MTFSVINSQDNEFKIFSYLRQDLPGALVVSPLEPAEVPMSVLSTYGRARAISLKNNHQENKFSLAGVQMKFSMKEKEGRYNLTKNGELGDWIIKTPSTKHKYVPLNEFTAMSLANLAGVDIPEIQLVKMNKLDNLPLSVLIAMVIYEYSGDGLADIQQFARRLLVNILLANGGAHLNNWSLLYQDKIIPRLSPAYELVFTWKMNMNTP